MRKVLVALGLGTVILFTGYAVAAEQTRERTRTRSTYQTGTQDQTRTRDQQRSQTKDQTQTRERAKDASRKTTK